MKNNKTNVKKLRVGRVYLITPHSLPGFSCAKQRPALYIGFELFGNIRKYLFMQIGSSKVNNKNIINFSNETEYFWKRMNTSGYFHIDVSKYEYLRVVDKPYKKQGDYVEMKYKDIITLKNIYQNRITELEPIRLKKAKEAAFKNDIEGSARQLILLKMIFPKKYKKMAPYAMAKKWRHAFEKLM